MGSWDPWLITIPIKLGRISSPMQQIAKVLISQLLEDVGTEIDVTLVKLPVNFSLECS